jgi:hypothetical protein
MNELTTGKSLPLMDDKAVQAVRAFEEFSLTHCPQVHLETEHEFHAGLYARTIMLPADHVLTGAEIRIPTLLILSGDVLVYGINGTERLTGYQVLKGQAGRKQLFRAIEDTWMTMLFATDATTPEEAEEQFTDEYDKLMSRRQG